MKTWHHRVRTVMLVLLSFTWASLSNADSSVWVYRPDGTLQCGMGQEETLAKSKEALEQLGAKVEASEKRTQPVMIIALCGAPTGKVNAHRISAEDWQKVKSGFVGPMGFAEWTYDSSTVEVFKYDGTLQCEMGKGIALEEMAKQLTAAGVKVNSKRKGSDGLMHISLCGASTGRVNIFEISRSDLKKAKNLKFEYYHGPRKGGPSMSGFEAKAGDDLFPWPW